MQAVFETDSADYYAEPMLATLKVVRPTALEKPTFKGGVTYDGTEKNIEDYLDGFDPDFMQIVGSGATGTVQRVYIRYSSYLTRSCSRPGYFAYPFVFVRSVIYYYLVFKFCLACIYRDWQDVYLNTG